MLRCLGALGAALAVPGCSSSSSPGASSGPTFFTDDERTALGVLADAILPPDSAPGGKDLGAVQYIERLLTALDGIEPGGAPTLFAGGPYSGRTPFGDGAGDPSKNYPSNEFATWLPVDRVTLASWKLALYGSAGVPGGGPNDEITGPVVGLRDQVKQGLDGAISSATKPFDQMSASDAADALHNLPKQFHDLLVELVSEAAWSAPEYGGNAGQAGWNMIHFAGDVQPLGYTIWDASKNAMVERSDAPTSTADPGADPDPLDSNTTQLVTAIVEFTNGTVFS